jgi:hypothetical protein
MIELKIPYVICYVLITHQTYIRPAGIKREVKFDIPGKYEFHGQQP